MPVTAFFKMSLPEMFSSGLLYEHWKEKKSEESFLGNLFFKSKRHYDRKMAFSRKGTKFTPLLTLSAYDVSVQPLNRGGFTVFESEFPFYKNSLDMNEEQIIEVEEAKKSNNEPKLTAIILKIYDDLTSLLDSAAITIERQRMQLLTTGVVSDAGNGQSFVVDYLFNPDNKKSLTGADKWTNTNSDPIKDMDEWRRQIQETTGRRLRYAIVNSTTEKVLRDNEKLRHNIFADKTITPFVTSDKVKTLIKEETKIEILTYDRTYQEYNSTGAIEHIKFIPDGVVVLVPEGILGYTCFGITPEEALKNSYNTEGSRTKVTVTEEGIAIMTGPLPTDYAQVSTKVSMRPLPTFEEIDSCIIAEVFSPSDLV